MLFKDDRFGMFIHFGLYAQGGWHEQHQLRLQVPKEEYIKFREVFDPSGFDADEIVGFAKEAGAQYICFTTKHHDGFCMWDTKYTDYNIMNTPYGKDVLKQLADACQRHGIKLELYYSVPDWNHKNSVNDGSEYHRLKQPNPGDEPDEDQYIQYIKNQMGELCTNYGKIHAIFWDIPPERRDPSVNAYVRSLQPHILFNDRGYDKGDYSTPEREARIRNASFDRLCEACQSVGAQSWGYRKEEDYFTPQYIIASMSSILMKGGNYLLNVGPDEKGRLPEESKRIFAAVGGWYKRIRESILDTKYFRAGNFDYTLRDNTVYLHLPAACGCRGFILKPFRVAPRRAVLLNNGQEVEAKVCYSPWDYDNDKNLPHLHIGNLPAEEFLGENMVVKMEFENVEAFLACAEETVAGDIL